MEPDLPPLIRALLEPQRYPESVRSVELVETHISWVLLAGAFAYKIKKPLLLPFLDFSTLQRREICCNDEVRLNQRFAPDIYLGVIGIFHTESDPQFAGPGKPIEYAVKMRRFDEAGRLDHVCRRGELQGRHLSGLADTLVAFHQSAEIAPATSDFGTPQQVMSPVLENFSDLSHMIVESSVQTRLEALRRWTEQQFAQLSLLMEQRRHAGRVRECHGDLHLANLVLINEQVRMFDCIEFNENLRWIDVASEVAFTYVDLLEHGEGGMANWFVNEVLSRSGDYESALVLRFYAVYRALVRAKIAAIRQSQAHTNTSSVLFYIALAERLVQPTPKQLVIMHGLSGCGKTAVSQRLLLADTRASTLRLRSDVERKRLFGIAVDGHSASPTGAGIYSCDESAKTYLHLHTLARMLLHAGWSVIVDAAFLKRADRELFRKLAVSTGAQFSIVAPKATVAQLRQRIAARALAGHDASEATLDVLDLQIRTVDPLDPQEIEQSLVDR